MSKKIFSTLFVVFVFMFLYVAAVVHDFFKRPIVMPGATTSVKVFQNQSLDELTARLYQEGIIHHPQIFEWIVESTGDRYQLRYGEYEIKYPMTTWQLMQNMLKGKGLVRHRFTIVNGWTFLNVRAALAQDTNLNQTIKNESNAAILKTVSADQTHIEGLFYPDTYFFTWGNSDVSLLKTAYQKMQKVLQNAWQSRAPNLSYKDAYQALIVASLIERETSVDSEKPIIASVILNRLKKNMRLQIDPTVEYGLEKTFSGKITKADLHSKTDYNTYVINGLPPTPICMPEISSINAALHPADTDYLYYVATGNGGHYFSKTYAEHLKQIEAYKKTLTEKDK